MARLINTFGDYHIEHKGLAQDYELLLAAYLDLRSELDTIRGTSY